MGYEPLRISVVILFVTFCFGLVDANAQEITVQGTVTTEQGETLPGVNISIQGTTRGTSSNAEGEYKLTVPSPSDTLLFSFIGYETEVVPVNGRNQIDVTLTATAIGGEELVVVGYGVQQKSDLTGSVSSVSAEELDNIPTQSLSNALQGKVSGVRITPESGRPGSQPQIRIRGVGTLNDSSPLFVVDGMLVNDISFLDPKNVQSVEVLKDASATAIYGSRGANGVIIVTTKKGRAGAPQVSVNSYYGLQRINNKIGLANGQQFATFANESASNEGRPLVFNNPDQFGVGTDWQDLVINDTAPVQSYQISASGGSDNSTYNISGSYFKQDGTVRGSDFQRISLRFNNQYNLSENVDFGHNITFTYNDSQEEANDLVNTALWADPTLPPRNEDGEFTNTNQNGGAGNPAASIFYNENNSYGFRTVGNAYVDIDFLEYFNFRSSFGLDWERDESKDFVPEFSVSPIQTNENSQLNVEDIKRTNWLNENTLKYQQDLGDHSLDILAGITFQEFVSEELGGSRINFPGSSPEFYFLNAGESGQTNFNTSFSWGMISYLFRANYVYDDRYLFTGTFRRDGSSRFASRNRWGNFPSFAVGWRISNESFMEGLTAVSNLKLRASWGQIGNDKIDTGAAIPTVTSNVNAVFGSGQEIHPGATVTELSNPELRWEETEQLDVGLELGLFEDRLTAEVDWYRRETKDILVRVPIPDIVGVQTPPIVNAASVLNRGIDFKLDWRQAGADFSYSIGVTGSTVHNEVLSLGEGQEEILGGEVRNIGFTTRTIPGHPIGAFYGWKQVGIFQDQAEIDNSPTRAGVNEQPGDIKIADINSFNENGELTGQPDGVIDEADKTFLGSPIPDFMFGINLNSSYKQFDISVDIDGQVGNEIVYGRKAIRGFRLLNYDETYFDRWTGPGTSNSEPRITEAGPNYQVLDWFIQDGDFIRLRNIQLGYALPVDVSESLSLKNIRFYVNATNVLTLTDYVGYTPQISGGSVINTGIDRGVYPVSSVYTVGIELDF